MMGSFGMGKDVLNGQIAIFMTGSLSTVFDLATACIHAKVASTHTREAGD